MSSSGEHPSGGGGWNHNWFPSPSSFPSSSHSPSPDLNFSPPHNTQSSGIPGGGYQPYPVDMQNATEGKYGWMSSYGSTQPLSQLPEGGGRGGGSGRGSDDDDDDDNNEEEESANPHVRTPYTPKEVEKLFEAYISVSEDPRIGTKQKRKTFWKRIWQIYLRNRPQGSVTRTMSMLRNEWRRPDSEIKKLQEFYLEEKQTAGSGSNELDIITAAMTAYATTQQKPFKHFSTWSMVHHFPRWRSGTKSSFGRRSRRSRSDLESDEVASQLVGANLNSSDTGVSPSRGRRPTGQKKTRGSD